jgi:hypothetical protein
MGLATAEKLNVPLVILPSASWACGSRTLSGVDYGHFTLAKPAPPWWRNRGSRRNPRAPGKMGTDGDEEEIEARGLRPGCRQKKAKGRPRRKPPLDFGL